MKISKYLSEVSSKNNIDPSNLQFPECDIDPDKVKVIMISEVPSPDPCDGFYGSADSGYMTSVRSLFDGAGMTVSSMDELLDMGIYITTAVKSSKVVSTIPPETIKSQLPILEAEIALFKNARAIMLMGDVAIKAVNAIVKAQTKKNVIPSGSTYKIRGGEYFYGDIRVFPSYIMTGKNLLIEKGKCDTISDDIRRMREFTGL
jgi:Uracil-DNA glycosylase